jgi:hypothetical protein
VIDATGGRIVCHASEPHSAYDAFSKLPPRSGLSRQRFRPLAHGCRLLRRSLCSSLRTKRTSVSASSGQRPVRCRAARLSTLAELLALRLSGSPSAPAAGRARVQRSCRSAPGTSCAISSDAVSHNASVWFRLASCARRQPLRALFFNIWGSTRAPRPQRGLGPMSRMAGPGRSPEMQLDPPCSLSGKPARPRSGSTHSLLPLRNRPGRPARLDSVPPRRDRAKHKTERTKPCRAVGQSAAARGVRVGFPGRKAELACDGRHKRAASGLYN